MAAVMLTGAVIEGSNDGTTYTPIVVLDNVDVHSGWNSWKKDSATYRYQYVRLSHDSTSACSLAEFKIIGIKYSTLPVVNNVDKTCDVVIKTGNKVLSGKVVYSHASTTIVNTISPAFGPSIGGDTLHLVGVGFGTTVTVSIDGIACAIINKTATELYCTTGRRASPPAAGNSFVLISNGNIAKIAAKPYTYIDRWSNTETWGG